MTLRLNAAMRDTICARVMAHRFDKPLREAADRVHEASNNAFFSAFTAEEREVLFNAPPGFFWKRRTLKVSDGIRSEVVEARFAQEIDLPYSKGRTQAVPVDPSVFSRLSEALDAEAALRAERNSAKRDVRALLDGVATLKRLLHVWPEVEPFTYALEQHSKTHKGLPATTGLNKRLDLPVEGKSK